MPSLPAAMHDPNGGDADLQFFDYMRMSLCGESHAALKPLTYDKA